jgi:phosphatidylserine/phosphatidylglycerophosphate/cardiolipin synthase-like enzyme
MAATLVTAPENALDPADGPLGLLGRAGRGDQVRVEQLDEPLWWGDGEVEGEPARNPRVAAYLAAARRGAAVRVLLDGFFDDPARPNSNAATVEWLGAQAMAEHLDLAARIGNPTGQGIHNKLILVALALADPPEYWSHIGSLNGSEAANKANREAAIQLRTRAVHDYLAAVFDWDWAASGANAVWLPWVGRTARGGR